MTGIFKTTIRNRSDVPGSEESWSVGYVPSTFESQSLRIESPDGAVHYLTTETVSDRFVATAGVRGDKTALAVRLGTDGSLLPRIASIDSDGVSETRFPNDDRDAAQRDGLFAVSCAVDPEEGPVLTVADMRTGSTVLQARFEIRGDVLRMLFSHDANVEPICAAFCGDGIAVSDPDGRCDALLSPGGTLDLSLAAQDVRLPFEGRPRSAELSAARIDDLASDLSSGAAADIWYDASDHGDDAAADVVGRTQDAMSGAARALLELRSLADDLAGRLAVAAAIAEREGAEPMEADVDLLRRASALLGTEFQPEERAGPGF